MHFLQGRVEMNSFFLKKKYQCAGLAAKISRFFQMQCCFWVLIILIKLTQNKQVIAFRPSAEQERA